MQMFFLFVSCVHPVAVLNDVFCMTFSLFMLAEDAWEIILNRHSPESECLILFTPSCCCEYFYYLYRFLCLY